MGLLRRRVTGTGIVGGVELGHMLVGIRTGHSHLRIPNGSHVSPCGREMGVDELRTLVQMRVAVVDCCHGRGLIFQPDHWNGMLVLFNIATSQVTSSKKALQG